MLQERLNVGALFIAADAFDTLRGQSWRLVHSVAIRGRTNSPRAWMLFLSIRDNTTGFSAFAVRVK